MSVETVISAINLFAMLIIIFFIFNLKSKLEQKSGLEFPVQQVEGRIQSFEKIFSENLGQVNVRLGEIKNNSENVTDLKDELIKNMQAHVDLQINQFRQSITDSISQMELRLQSFEKTNELKFDTVNSQVNKNISNLQNDNQKNLEQIRSTVGEKLQSMLSEKISESTKDLQSGLHLQIQQFKDSVKDSINQMENRIQTLEKTSTLKAEEVKKSLSQNFLHLQDENRRQLNSIRETVDEKLQSTLEKRISKSFKNVSERLEQVQFGLGEMKNLADDVGGLKKILSGVKTRGILGEIQLEAILQEILSPTQYDKNVATVPNSSCRVEFAIKIPSSNGKDFVYIPIDSKFPLESYQNLQDAIQNGDKNLIEDARIKLKKAVLTAAKDIKEKYIYPPETVNFGIMFLPFEGLYVEVINSGLLEELHRKYQVNVAGPSTMSAFLNSLRIGFQMFSIQKRSDEVWKILGTVKTEFGKFEEVLKKMQNNLDKANSTLGELIGTRTRAIQRTLKNVEEIDDENLMISMLNK